VSPDEVDALLNRAGSGRPLSDDDVRRFVAGATSGALSRPQVAAWLAWAYARTLTAPETAALTDAMVRSGVRLSWGSGGLLVDKHSTGGVGDKVSLILAPLWAELGWRVPMISGRGLGHTGGTLDKLESIPGFRTDLSVDELRGVLERVGCFISGQTADLAPADRVLYSVRNETGTVASIPLIVGSILSKKLAEGIERLVLDVKVGPGAFMKTPEDAAALARALVDTAVAHGVSCVAHLTPMFEPLGVMVGNALEVDEAAACLRGGGSRALAELVVSLAEHPDAAEVLASGRAYPRFLAMIEAQGGDPRAVDRGVAGGTESAWVVAPRSGVVHTLDAGACGRAAMALGGGRMVASDAVDPMVGLEVLAPVGAVVAAGDPIVRLAHRGGHGLERARALVEAGLLIGEGPVEAPRCFGRVGA
jgi:pyrimidine-nucleoside phosphorylase